MIEPFSPGTNVIVGRNGSGKSNFFAAIRFVLGDGDDFHHMKAQDRARLLHEGSGSAVMSAYVEIIFDNTDKRFSEPGDEVVIRRTIGMKKDEYSVDRKAQTRAEVMKILETAGFAKENPFYIVPQGRIAAITNMKESERLNLLKEIAGTITYDDRRSQSLILMKETTTKREKIDELLTYIEERLNELEEEKNDLHQFQIKDRERRCLEYAHWHRLHESTIEKLQQIEAAKQGGAGATNKETTQLQQVEREIADLEQKYQEVDENLEFLETERRQLDEDRKEKARSRAKAELNVKNLDAGRHAHEQQKKAREAALNEVRQKIEALEKELATIAPQYGNWKAEEERFRTERDQIKDKRDRLMTKQTRSSQFKTKAERDNYLKQEINQITQSLGTQKAIRVDHVEQAERLKQSIAQLEQEIQEKRKEKGSYSDKREALYQKLQSAEAACDRLTEERRQLQREVHNFDSKVSSATKKLEKAQGTLARVMDGPTAKGLAAIKRFTRERNIPGAYGTLAELMTIPVEGYRLAAETIASKSLFHYVVDNHVTATILGEHLQKNALGRVTFLPLEQLRPKQVKMPRASDAQPLISKIEYDPKYEKAFQLVFGRTIVCPTMSIGIQYARTHGLDAITPEGELANKRGALTGGYIDPGRSRLEAVQEVNRVQDERAQYEAEREKVEEQLNVVVQQITKSLGESKKLEQELRDLDRSYSSLDEALQAKISELERERPHLKALELRLQGVEKYLNDLDNQLSAAEAELQTDFKKVLSAEEDRELEELSRQLPTLTAKVRSANKKRLELESRKDSIELQLESQLRPREDQLQSQAIEFLSGGASGNFKDAAKELQRAEKAAAVVEAQLRENEEKIAEVAAQRAKLDTVKAQKEAEKEELERRIDQYKKKMQKSILREAQLVIEAKAYEKNISELGILPEEAFGKYEKMKSEQVYTPPIPCLSQPLLTNTRFRSQTTSGSAKRR